MGFRLRFSLKPIQWFTSLHLQELSLGFGCCALQRLIQVSPLSVPGEAPRIPSDVTATARLLSHVCCTPLCGESKALITDGAKGGQLIPGYPWAVLEFHTHGTKVTKVQCDSMCVSQPDWPGKFIKRNYMQHLAVNLCMLYKRAGGFLPLIHMVALCSTQITVLSTPDHCLYKPAEELPKWTWALGSGAAGSQITNSMLSSHCTKLIPSIKLYSLCMALLYRKGWQVTRFTFASPHGMLGKWIHLIQFQEGVSHHQLAHFARQLLDLIGLRRIRAPTGCSMHFGSQQVGTHVFHNAGSCGTPIGAAISGFLQMEGLAKGIANVRPLGSKYYTLIWHKSSALQRVVDVDIIMPQGVQEMSHVLHHSELPSRQTAPFGQAEVTPRRDGDKPIIGLVNVADVPRVTLVSHLFPKGHKTMLGCPPLSGKS